MPKQTADDMTSIVIFCNHNKLAVTRVHHIVWCLTKFMLTTITDFDTALVMDKNSSMDIVSVW